jgi:hypothetical protein
MIKITEVGLECRKRHCRREGVFKWVREGKLKG